MTKKSVSLLLSLFFVALVVQAVWMPLGYARGSTTVTGYNTQTEWGPTGVGVASDRVMFTVDLLGGTCFGTFDGKGDILGFNETSGFYFIQGTGYWSVRLSGSYSGGMSNTGSGAISGTITGTYDGSPLNIGVSGYWELAVDAPSGIMGVEMNLVYSNKPADLTYTAYMVRYMSFPPVPYVESLKIGVEYQPLFVSKPGTYSMVVVVSASDAKDHSGAPVIGRRINFDANSPYPYVLEPSGITNQVGEAINTMYITIPDLSQLPQQITVSAFEPLSEFGISITVDIQQTQSDISISDVSPGSEQGGVWLTDVNDVRVNGRVTGLNMDTVEVSVGVDTKEGSYVHDSRPKLDENGYFSVPLSMYTAGEEYKVSVTAFDASGLTVSDTVTVKYLGPSLVKILSVYNPDWVDPKQYDSFDVEVEVKVVSVEPTGLTVDLSMGSHYDQKLVQAQAGENTYQVTFNVPIIQIQTVSYDALAEATAKTLVYVPGSEIVEPVQQQPQSGGLPVIIDSKTDNGSSDTSTTNGPLISEVDIGARVTIGTRLPYPENRNTVNNRFSCETKQWARLSRHSTVLSDLVNKRQTYPQWIQALGVGINIQWTKVGNVDFEVISATVEVIRLPYNFAEAGTTYVNQGVFTVSGNVQSTSTVWGKNYNVPSGEYKVRVTYRVKYTVNGEDVEDEFMAISNDSFFVKRKRANPCDMDDFHHQTIYEKKTSVGTGRTDFRLNEQGDVSSGSYSPGASSQGVGGTLGVPKIQTVAFIPVQAQASPVTLYLDWDDPSADLDLTVIDPLGRTVTYLYSEGLVVNGIPGVVYSGINVKPEWIRFENTVEGEYIVSAYLVKSTGAVDAWFRIGESVTTEVEVTDHILGSGIDADDTLSGVGSKFTPDDIVYSRIDFSNIRIGDTVRWVITGPNGISVEKSTEMAFSGEAYAYAPIELIRYDADSVTGAWSVTVHVNDVVVSIVSFTVDSSDPLGGLIPGFPVLGLLTGLAVIVWGIRWRQPSRGYQV